MSKRKNTGPMPNTHPHIRNILAAIPPFLWVAAFVLWCFSGEKKPAPVLLFSAASTLIAALATLRLVSAIRAKEETGLITVERFHPRTREDRPSRRHPLMKIFFLALLSRLVLFLCVWFIDRSAAGGYHGGLADLASLYAPRLFTTPAAALIGLSPEEILLSCDLTRFPLWPLIVTKLSPAFSSPVYAGCLISALCTAAAAPMLYEFVLACDETTARANVALLYLLFSPLTLPLLFANEAAPVLALSLASLLCSRRNRAVGAGIFAFFAVLVHPAAIILTAVLLWDRFSAFRLAQLLHQQNPLGKTLVKLLSVCLPPFGLAVPIIAARNVAGAALPLTNGLSFRWFAEEGAERLAALSGIGGTGLLPWLIHAAPVLLPLCVPLLALLTAHRVRPSTTAALLMSVWTLAYAPAKSILPLLACGWPVLASMPFIGRGRAVRIPLAAAAFILFLFIYVGYARGTLAL